MRRSATLALLWFFVLLLPAAMAHAVEVRIEVGAFTVVADSQAVRVDGHMWPGGLGTPHAERVLTGSGTIRITGQPAAVRFSDIRGRLDLPRQTVVATAGAVLGVADAGAPTLGYDLQGFPVQIRRDSIRLTPSSATAEVTVTVPAAFFADTPSGTLPLTSFSISASPCAIVPDGSIEGERFHRAVSFSLKDSVYRLEIADEERLAVHLGVVPREKAGVQLAGFAFREDVRIFRFRGIVASGAEDASFTLDFDEAFLSSPANSPARPELGYELTLKKTSPGTPALASRVMYHYGKTGLLDCKGTVWADLRLPDSVLDGEGHALAMLDDIELKTDKTGVLFNSVGKARLRKALAVGYANAGSAANAVFRIEVDKDDKADSAARIYFPIWHKTHASYPAFGPDKKPARCSDIRQVLDHPPGGEGNDATSNRVLRPGLTVFRGTLYFKAPQVTFGANPPADPYSLKTLFRGALTLTPGGITGDLQSSVDSFIGSEIPWAGVPGDPRRVGADTHVRSQAYTWDELLAMSRNDPPTPPAMAVERFRLVDLRILGMRVANLGFCSSEIDNERKDFRYDVHFPFPSFIDLEFRDKSLDAAGNFLSAQGPVTTWSDVSQPGALPAAVYQEVGKKKPDSRTLNPDTQVLWAWRLPVTFAPGDVEVKYLTGASPGWKTDVGLGWPRQPVGCTGGRIEGNVCVGGETVSSELWVRPLYSKNSALKAGVRFGARFDADGGFRLIDWDTDLFFAQAYARVKPGSVAYAGFDCRLKGASQGIVLADPPRANSRPDDLRWEGRLRFPFFGERDAGFSVKELVPGKQAPAGLDTGEGNRCVHCQNDQETPGLDSGNWLRVTVPKVSYSPVTGHFTASDVTVVEKINNMDHSPVTGAKLDTSSFTHAIVALPALGRQDYALPEGKPTRDLANEGWKESPQCGKETRQILANAVSTDTDRDLVCHDAAAYGARDVLGLCCGRALRGAYKVQTRPVGQPSAVTDVLLAPSATFRADFSPPALFVQGSQMSLQSDASDAPYSQVVNIPSAQLAFKNDGTVQGAFGATYTPVATSLPYEGVFRFRLDPTCGYYYFQSGGSFTYLLRFSGEVLVVHAPFRHLRGNPWQDAGVSSLLEDLGRRALFADVGGLLAEHSPGGRRPGRRRHGNVHGRERVLHVRDRDHRGRARRIRVPHRPGRVARRFTGPGPSTTCWRAPTSTVLSGEALEHAGLPALGTPAQGEFDSLQKLVDFLKASSLSMQWQLTFSACGYALVGHCEAGLQCRASCSTASGLDLQCGDVCSHCDTGDCNGCR